MRLSFFLCSGLLVVALSGCSTLPGMGLLSQLSFMSPYKMDIRQGNYIDPVALDKLKLGMTRQQVQFIMGSPLISDVFHADRWDYIYSLQHDGKLAESRRVTLYFDPEGKLARIDRSGMPEQAPAAASVVPAAPAAAKG